MHLMGSARWNPGLWPVEGHIHAWQMTSIVSSKTGLSSDYDFTDLGCCTAAIIIIVEVGGNSQVNL